MESIKQQLQSFLNSGDVITIMKAEKDINFDVIFQTSSKAFCCVAPEKEGELLSSIVKLTVRFVSVNFPDVSANDISIQFAVDVVHTRPDWNLLDILHFFKFIRQRQDLPENKIFGNKITPLKLMELTAVYETNKSIAREQWHRKETNQIENGTQQDRMMLGNGSQRLIGGAAPAKDTRFADLAKELNAKLQQKGNQVYENVQATKKFLKDIQSHWEQQMGLVSDGTITEEQAQINHVKFRDNYELANKVPS